jgi:hypothetical protein
MAETMRTAFGTAAITEPFDVAGLGVNADVGLFGYVSAFLYSIPLYLS